MSSAPALLRRHFLGWERPWLRQAIEWLTREWSGCGAIDLSGWLVVVPTRQAGRRLREALAEYAAERGTAVFAPRVLTPDALLSAAVEAKDVASRLECLLAWTEVLREVDLAEISAVFPVAPPQRDFAWAWRVAETFFDLQSQLNESGLALGDVVARAGPEFPETARWEELAALEARQVAWLRGIGKRESHLARRREARVAPVPEGIARVAVLAVPDPLPLALEVLARWAETVPVEVVVHAPAGDAAAFDLWGRPDPAIWSARNIELPAWQERVHVCADAQSEAQRVAAAIAAAGPDAVGGMALGIADPEVVPLLENALSRAGVPSFNPEGKYRRSGRWHGLMAALAALVREPRVAAIAALARCPDMLLALARRGGPEFSAARFLRQLDAVQADHLPADLAALRAAVHRHCPEAADLTLALAVFEDLRARLQQGTFPENARAVVAELFEGRRFDRQRPDEAALADAAGAWRDVLRECAAAREHFPRLDERDGWEIALALFGSTRRGEDKAPGALDLQGWLEVLWEDAPHLLVVGFNEGLVPESVVGDAFLPEGLRRRLQLKTNEARFARDAFILQAIAAVRRDEGRLDVLLARNSAVGDPLRPSRLLLRCADAELPARIDFLFQPAVAARTSLPWTRAWKLSPGPVTPPARVAVTGLRAWLDCPFRFFLQHVRRMEEVDPEKSEMDARDFGTLCHAALEAMAREPALRDCTDEGVLRAFLLAQLERAARDRFGDDVTLPLVVQLESARQRLGRAAAVQAQQRADGWVIERVEWSFEVEVAGLTVRGKIDRCDRHERTGRWRVLDYKTTDSGTPPHAAHLRGVQPEDDARPRWMRVAVEEREQVWKDLQLPLYVQALRREFPGADVACGYFLLPKAVGETTVVTWDELSPDLLAAAQACAEGVARAIRAGDYWPPMERAAHKDSFAPLFHRGAAGSVEWEGAR